MFKPYSYAKKIEYDVSTPKKKLVTVKFDLGKYLPVLAFKTVVSAILIVGGIYMMVTQVFIPVVDTYANSSDVAPIISPIAEDEISSLSIKEDEAFEFKELNASFRDIGNDEPTRDARDLLLAKPEEGEDEETSDEPEFFYISIPALEIEEAKVEVNSTNLDPLKSLGHYKGTCLPDEACNSFIFGHSTYKNAKNRYKRGDYSAIFAHLDELKYGDEFTIKYKDKEYRYVVELTKVDRPENIDPLGQPLPRSLGKHESTVELFTCTPSGTTKYRLSVVGRLVNVSEF